MGKILITGAGRCGTTAFIQLLSAMGMDTGTKSLHYNESVNAGLENTLLAGGSTKPLPRVIKDPRLGTKIGDLFDRGIEIDFVFVLVRDQKSCAQSRVRNNITWLAHDDPALCGSAVKFEDDETSQIVFNQRLLATLITDLTLHKIKFITIPFPLFVEDFTFLYNTLSALPFMTIGGMPLDFYRANNFYTICERVLKPSLVHIKPEDTQ